MDIERVAEKYALKNAVEHEGKCNPGAVIGKIFAEGSFQDKKVVQEKAKKVCQRVNELTEEQQLDKIEEYEFEEDAKDEKDPIPDLEEVEEGEVTVRFAPNPNAPPHIGHGRGMVINGEIKKKYNGKLILRYDDTDPVTKRPLITEEINAYDVQKEDYEWLGYDIDEIKKCSENFDKYIEYADKLIDLNKAYVCECTQEEGQKYRKEGEACPHRERNKEENKEKWEEMQEGLLEEGDAVLKVKTDMSHKNPAIRDFVAFRIINSPEHPITGNEYKVWPMLDFQGAIEDHELGTTHIFRGKGLRASAERQKYIYNYFGWDYPEVQHWGKIKISGFEAPVSSSKLRKMIENNELSGWDDPRAPTLMALRRRGFQPEAIRNFFIDMGVTENDLEASIKTLEKENTRVIDDETERRFFVDDPVKLEIKNVPEDVEVNIPAHPEEDLGVRKFELDSKKDKIVVFIEKNDLGDGLFRLKGLCNVKISEGVAEYVEGDYKKVIDKGGNIIHWVPSSSEEAKVLMPDGSEKSGLLEPVTYEKGEVYQFERFGFVRFEGGLQFCFAHE